MTLRKTVIAFLLMAAMIAGISNTAGLQAASKKTVRVAIAKELKAALKDTSVGTVILRTETFDPITISSKKTKKKKLIVDAPNSIVTNRSVFKSVEIISARKYIEDVSGNTLSVKGKTDLEIAAEKSVKKLTFSDQTVYFNIRKKASVKTLSYKSENISSSFDSKTNELTVSDKSYSSMGEEYVIKYIYKLDKSGRVLSIARDKSSGGNVIRTYQYDDNGNLLVEEQKLSSGETQVCIKNTYDKNNNRTSCTEEYYSGEDTSTYREESEYDKNGNEIKRKLQKPSETFMYEISYDTKGRPVKGTVTSLEPDKSYVVEYKYDKKGFLIKQLEYVNGEEDTVSTNTYDKFGNKVSSYIVVKNPDGDDYSLERIYSFDELGNETGREVKYNGQ